MKLKIAVQFDVFLTLRLARLGKNLTNDCASYVFIYDLSKLLLLFNELNIYSIALM